MLPVLGLFDVVASEGLLRVDRKGQFDAKFLDIATRDPTIISCRFHYAALLLLWMVLNSSRTEVRNTGTGPSVRHTG